MAVGPYAWAITLLHLIEIVLWAWFYLLVVGWLHRRYLWPGDILFLHAALGLVLPLFRQRSDRALPFTWSMAQDRTFSFPAWVPRSRTEGSRRIGRCCWCWIARSHSP